MSDITGAEDERPQNHAEPSAPDADRSGPDADRSGPDARREKRPNQDEFSREDYAIHARRSELPLFGQAVAGGRDDGSWISALSGSIGAATKAAADPTIAKAADAITRRPRRKG